MIYIKKQAEPGKLLQYRHQPGARFDDMDADVKEQLRESLLREQGHLCAYCMRRINGQSDVKIEHLKARTPENELLYHNLLAVCKGGEGEPPWAQSCDTKKGNRPLFISPLSRTDMNRIYYKNNGEIHSFDDTGYEFTYVKAGKHHKGFSTPDQDLSDCLNLNYENGAPMAGRKSALRKFQVLLHRYRDDRSKKAFLEKMQQYYLKEDEFLPPYVGILRWYIEKKLKKYR